MMLFCSCINRLSFLFLFLFFETVSAQITESITDRNYFDFTIHSEKKTVEGKVILILHLSKGSIEVLTDTALTDKKSCTGFAVPEAQPFKEYFIFSKHEKGNGKTYILSNKGECTVISGGTFWVAPKHWLLILLAERDLTNLVIYSLKEKKVLIEKFNCDEFDGWYYHRGNYMGSVTMECGLEPEHEREISAWLRPIEVEEYEPSKNNLYETHTTENDLEKARRLVRYASCK